IIRARLNVNERPLRILTTRFHKWCQALSVGTNEDIERELQSLLHEVTYFELSISKTQLVAEMAERERLSYEQSQQRTEENIARSEKELEVLTRELEEAKQERANKILYDQLATEVSRFPSRQSNQESIATLQSEIQELEDEAVRQGLVMELRKKQFYDAFSCLQNIHDSIEEDQQEEQRRLYLKRTHPEDDEEEDQQEDGFAHAEEGSLDVTADVEGDGGGNGAHSNGAGDGATTRGTTTPRPASTISVIVNEMQHSLSLGGSGKGSNSSIGSQSPALGPTNTLTNGTIGQSGEEGSFRMGLHRTHSTDSLGITPAGTPRIGYQPSPTLPPRSEVGTPIPVDDNDTSMNVDTLL
ncbi:THO complex subunit 7, partial [Lobosporangium transversale]